MYLTSPWWWYALAAYTKDKAEGFIGFCLYIANSLEGMDVHDPE